MLMIDTYRLHVSYGDAGSYGDEEMFLRDHRRDFLQHRLNEVGLHGDDNDLTRFDHRAVAGRHRDALEENTCTLRRLRTREKVLVTSTINGILSKVYTLVCHQPSRFIYHHV